MLLNLNWAHEVLLSTKDKDNTLVLVRMDSPGRTRFVTYRVDKDNRPFWGVQFKDLAKGLENFKGRRQALFGNETPPLQSA